MDFSEALVHLKNGEYIRRKSWKNKTYHYKLEDYDFYGSTGDLVSLYNSEILADDWEVYKKVFFNPGTLIRLDDGIVGIVLEFNEYTKEYTILNENECVETYHESEVSRVEGEEFEPFVETTQAFYNGLIKRLRDCSNELEENK